MMNRHNPAPAIPNSLLAREAGPTYVIAPLQPVSDCLLPLLSGLFHQAWRAGLVPPQALADAKRRLVEGDWYPDTAERVRVAYTTTLNAYLPRLLAEPNAQRQREGLRALRKWPPYVRRLG